MLTMAQTTPPTRRLFTVDEYVRMGESGIFDPEERVELLEGEIIRMSAIAPMHALIVNRLSEIFVSQAGGEAIVSVQNPIHLDDHSQPQPDLTVVRRDRDYSRGHPRPDWILLLVEVADSSLEFDRSRKLPRYAASGIAEVWIVEVHNQVVVQHTLPQEGRYTQRAAFALGSPLQSTALPGVKITTDRLFS